MRFHLVSLAALALTALVTQNGAANAGGEGMGSTCKEVHADPDGGLWTSRDNQEKNYLHGYYYWADRDHVCTDFATTLMPPRPAS